MGMQLPFCGYVLQTYQTATVQERVAEIGNFFAFMRNIDLEPLRPVYPEGKSAENSAEYFQEIIVETDEIHRLQLRNFLARKSCKTLVIATKAELIGTGAIYTPDSLLRTFYKNFQPIINLEGPTTPLTMGILNLHRNNLYSPIQLNQEQFRDMIGKRIAILRNMSRPRVRPAYAK